MKDKDYDTKGLYYNQVNVEEIGKAKLMKNVGVNTKKERKEERESKLDERQD